MRGSHRRRAPQPRAPLPPLRSPPCLGFGAWPLPRTPARLRRPWLLLSVANHAPTRACSGAPDQERRMGRPLLPPRGPARRRRDPARRGLHCSVLLRLANASAMEISGAGACSSSFDPFPTSCRS